MGGSRDLRLGRILTQCTVAAGGPVGADVACSSGTFEAGRAGLEGEAGAARGERVARGQSVTAGDLISADVTCGAHALEGGGVGLGDEPGAAGERVALGHG